jgi:catechol 2,3-dioxygenase-like lactoylglutathione lyase family enzyme
VRFAYLRLAAFKIEVIGDADPFALPLTNDVGELLGRSGFNHLCIHVENIDRAIAGLKARQVEIFAEPFELPVIGKRLAMIKDNSGNVVEFAQDITG